MRPSFFPRHISLLALPAELDEGSRMLGRKTTAVLATLAVGGAIALGGCGSDDSTAAGTTPSGQSSEGAMKHEDSMKGHDDAMKHDDDAMKHEDSMKGDDDAMHGEGSMHGEQDDHGEAMKGN